jgi:hypothetical protein
MKRAELERYDILLSHAPADAALAEAARERLVEAGLACVSAPTDTESEDYPEQLRGVLDASRAYVALLSRASIGSKHLLLEVGAAWAIEVPVFLLLNGVRPAEVSAFLKRYPSYSLWQGLPKLIRAVRELPERLPA